jgi:probable F420-dependent oxidoreductase
MDIGLVTIPTDLSAPVADVAREAEARGLSSLFIGGDHTHIPASRATPFPVAFELPDEYRRSLDPIVALGAAVAATSRLRLGTCIYLTAQRDTIDTAKKVASLDFLSGGRIEFGVGYGWNVEEAADHGVVWASRRDLVREQVLAMKAFWTEDEAAFTGEHVTVSPSWMWPKPVARPHPPVLLGASPGPRAFAAIIEWADGWFPVPFWGHTPGDVEHLRRVAGDSGRDPTSLRVIVNGVSPEAAQLEPWLAVDADEALVVVPTAPRADVLPVLDAAAALVDLARTT